MYKVLIVDDEPGIRNTLKKLISCYNSNYEIVGEAVNGIQGLSLIKEKVPDIVILDIKMPEMDGIALMEKLKKQHLNCKIILLTAYNDFNYARSALKLSALDYLLKPVNREDLRKVLNKAVMIIKKEKEGFEREASIKKLLDKSVNAYRDTILNQLIDGDNYEKVINDIPSIFTVKYEFLVIMVFNVFEELSVKNIHLKELKQLIEDDMNPNIRGYCFFDKDKKLVFLGLIDIDEKDDPNSIVEEYAGHIQSVFYSLKGIKIPIGIGNIYNSLCSIFKSYSEACIASEYRFVLTEKRIISISDCSSSNFHYKYPTKIENYILNALLLGDSDSIIINFNGFFNVATNEPINPSNLKQICMQLGVTILKKIKELNIYNQLNINDDTYFYDMNKYETVHDYRNQLIQIIFQIISILNENGKSRNELKLRKMVDKYLENNYSRNIGLIDVAKDIGVTPNYFSSLFKKEIGENFVEYLTRFRMQVAKKILTHENVNISKVAEMVGYSDVKYFLRVFRKLEGITPKEYKQLNSAI